MLTTTKVKNNMVMCHTLRHETERRYTVSALKIGIGTLSATCFGASQPEGSDGSSSVIESFTPALGDIMQIMCHKFCPFT